MSRNASRLPFARLGVRLLAGLFASTVAATVALGQVSSSAEQEQGALSYHSQYGAQSGQNSGGYGNGGYKQYPKYGEPSFHHLAIVAGGGFDAPLGNTRKTQTFGYNIKAGAGYNFNRRLGVLAEFGYTRLGIPNSVLAAAQAPDGHTNLFSIGLDPVWNYSTSSKLGGYVTGGAGYTHKSTAFTATVATGQYECDFYGYCYPDYETLDLGHFSSNQLGLNIGTGITHNIGDSGAKLFAEARYEWINSPSSTEGHVGSGTMSLIPVTFGVRF